MNPAQIGMVIYLLFGIISSIMVYGHPIDGPKRLSWKWSIFKERFDISFFIVITLLFPFFWIIVYISLKKNGRKNG